MLIFIVVAETIGLVVAEPTIGDAAPSAAPELLRPVAAVDLQLGIDLCHDLTDLTDIFPVRLQLQIFVIINLIQLNLPTRLPTSLPTRLV